MNIENVKIGDLIRYEYDTTTMCHYDFEYRYSPIKSIEKRYNPFTGKEYNLFITSKGSYHFKQDTKKGLDSKWREEFMSSDEFKTYYEDEVKKYGIKNVSKWMKNIIKNMK